MSSGFTQLVEGCRRRDRKAQRELYDTLSPMAMGVCMRYAADRQQAQDLMQDGFIKVYENIDSLREPESLGAWVYGIMVNVGINHCLKAKRYHFVDEGELEAVTLPLDPFSMEEVVRALQQLPERPRMAFNLVEVEGYSIDEAAERMKMTASGLRATLCRAKAMLRRKLKSEK